MQLQKMKTEKDLQLIPKCNRNTLSTQFVREGIEFRSGNIPSPSKGSQMRINFTYNKPNIDRSSKELQSSAFLINRPSRPTTSLQPYKKTKIEKRLSNMLCSGLYSHAYNPMEEYSRKNRSCDTSLLRSRQSNACLKPYESKITAA